MCGAAKSECWADRNKSLLRKSNLGVQTLKMEYEAENEGWRQALAERARQELAGKEAALRAQLTAERDQQIQLVRASTQC